MPCQPVVSGVSLVATATGLLASLRPAWGPAAALGMTLTFAAALGARCLPCCSAANTGVTAVKKIVAAWRNGVVFLGAGVPSERTCHAGPQRREFLGARKF